MDNELKILIDKQVMVSEDAGIIWKTGEVTSVEGDWVAVGFYNPITGDSWVEVFDSSNEDFRISVV